jgi:hypothetical protein
MVDSLLNIQVISLDNYYISRLLAAGYYTLKFIVSYIINVL